jgi:TPP-dependent trihydroxycyclohexane-1,2-dione (THcHDO) dehydratase
LLLDSPAAPQPRLIDEAIALLKSAQRPVIMACVGAYFSDAG